MTDKKSIRYINLLISLLIAFSGWVYVIYNFFPTKVVTYHDVPITFEGEKTLAYRGLGVESASESSLDVKLTVRRSDIADLTSEDIMAVVNLEDTVKGDNGASIEILTPDGTSLVSQSIHSVSVRVGEGGSKTVPATVIYGDAPEAAIEPVVNSMNESEIKIFGAKEDVDKVEFAAVVLKSTDTSEKPMSFEQTPVALDKDGEVVEHIVFSPEKIRVDVVTGMVKEVPLVLNVSDESSVSKSYEGPKMIAIKGLPQTLEKVEWIETEDISLSGITDDTDISLTYKLPDGVSVAYKSLHKKLKVKINKGE